MRIDSSTTALFGTQPVTKTNRSEAIKSLRSGSEVQSPFNVQLTNMVDKLSGVQASSGDIRTEKVDAIRQQLTDGSYNISGQDVASKLLLALQSQ